MHEASKDATCKMYYSLENILHERIRMLVILLGFLSCIMTITNGSTS